MSANRFSSPRTRAAALAVAFSVVAGGVAVATLPSIAMAVEDGTASASAATSTITADTASVPFSASGFTPGNVAYVQVEDPTGAINYSWGSTPYTVGDDGTVAGELARFGDWLPGVYTVTVVEGESLRASFTFEATADDGSSEVPTTTEPSDTAPVETEPTETEPTITTEPTETEPADTEPAETEPVETEPADSDDATDPGLAEPPATDDGGEAEPPTVTIGDPAAWAEHDEYSADVVAADGVTYFLTGFTPGVELELVLTLPSGEQAVFGTLEPIIPDARGEYSGVITYSGQWPEGEYTVTVTTIEGQTIPVDLIVPGDDDAESGADDAADGTAGEPGGDDGEAQDDADATGDDDEAGADETGADETGADDQAEPRTSNPVPAPIQSTSFTFSVTREHADGGTGDHGGSYSGNHSGNHGGKGDRGGQLATSGDDGLFGAAGLGLLALGVGAAAVVGGRFLSRRRNS